jgi:hypothetical protein
MAEQAPHRVTLSVHAPAVAANADKETVIGVAPEAGTVASVTFTPDTVLTGANTDTRTLAVYNRKQDGTGTVLVAQKAFTSGVNIAADDEGTITLTATAADLAVAAGDVLAFHSTHAGSTGLADPGGEVVVQIDRSA